jgi:hypothetical protein
VEFWDDECGDGEQRGIGDGRGFWDEHDHGDAEWSIWRNELGVVTGGPLTVTPITLPTATLNQPYSVQLQAVGGAPPYRWVLVGGSLPPGLSLSSTGVLSGTPTGPAGGVALGNSSPFYVYVVDSKYNSVQPTTGFSLTVSN